MKNPICHQNDIFRANAIAEKERASQEKLDKVISFTEQTFVPYFDKANHNRLCGFITEYYLSDSLPKIKPIKLGNGAKGGA